jgi:uncharacterized protein YdaU (DUF1376 family)
VEAAINYYERHLGDYAKDAGHLSMLEHGAYTLLLDRYYTTEQPIPADQAHRVCRARTREERAAVDAVLAEFFVLDGAVYRNGRANREITKMQAKVKAAQENGKLGGRPKRTDEKPGGFPLGSESVTQQKALQSPVTSNQEIPPNPRKRGQVSEFPPGFDAFWSAFPRKQAKPAAAKAFARLRADESLLARMLDAVAQQAASEQWRRDGGQFIPLPASWLNGHRWEDAPLSAVSGSDIFAGAE